MTNHSDTFRSVCCLCVACTGGLLSGCASASRSVLALEAPRIYLHTFLSSDELRRTLVTESCSLVAADPVHPSEALIIRGTGTLRWPAVSVAILDDSITINRIRVESRLNGWRNVTIDEAGRIYVDRFIRFER